MKMKLALFVTFAAVALLGLALNSEPAAQANIANKLRPFGASGPRVTQAADNPSVPSPFGALACVSSDCFPVHNVTPPDLDAEKLHPQIMISSLLGKIGKGDTAALAQASEVLHGCFVNHRNRLLANNAFGIMRPAEINECESSHLTDLILMTDSAVSQGFRIDSPNDSSKGAVQMRWLATRALLDDEILQLAALPKIIPDSRGSVDFSELPVPPRNSPIWKRVATFVNEHRLSDPEVQNLARSLTERSEDPLAIVDSVQ